MMMTDTAASSKPVKGSNDDNNHQNISKGKDGNEYNDDNADTDPTKGSPATADKPSLYKLLSLAKPEWPVLVVAFGIMIAAESTGLLNPILVAKAYDALVNVNLDRDERLSQIHQTMLTELKRNRPSRETTICFGCNTCNNLM